MDNRTLMHIAKTCDCVVTHVPSSYVPNHHHILPQSWGGATVESNMVWLCPNSHTATHDLLNQYIYAGGQPTNDILSHYNMLVRALAATGWSKRPSDRPPFTTAHP